MTFSLSKDTQFSRTQKVSNTIEDAWHVGTSVSFEYSWGAPDEVFNKKVIVGMDFFWEHTKSHTEETTEGSSVSSPLSFQRNTSPMLKLFL